jgi:hypothetical protein
MGLPRTLPTQKQSDKEKKKQEEREMTTNDHSLGDTLRAYAAQEHPEATSEAVGRVIAGYSARAPAAARSGAALALRACTPRLGPQQVPAALDFLLAAGLGDPDDEVRAQMVAAGVGCPMLHFRSYFGWRWWPQVRLLCALFSLVFGWRWWAQVRLLCALFSLVFGWRWWAQVRAACAMFLVAACMEGLYMQEYGCCMRCRANPTYAGPPEGLQNGS